MQSQTKRQCYARVIGLLLCQHDVDLQQVHTTGLTAHPLSMLQADGQMRVVNVKSKLKNNIKFIVSQRLLDD